MEQTRSITSFLKPLHCRFTLSPAISYNFCTAKATIFVLIEKSKIKASEAEAITDSYADTFKDTLGYFAYENRE